MYFKYIFKAISIVCFLLFVGTAQAEVTTKHIPVDFTITHFALSSDNSQVLIAGLNQLQVIEVETGNITTDMSGVFTNTGIIWNDSLTYAVTYDEFSTNDREIQIWDLELGELLRVLNFNEKQTVWTLPNSNKLLLSDTKHHEYNNFQIYDIEKDEFMPIRINSVRQVSFSPGGSYIIFQGQRWFNIYDTQEPKRIDGFEMDYSNSSLIVWKDNESQFLLSHSNMLMVYDIEQVDFIFSTSQDMNLLNSNQIFWSQDGQYVLAYNKSTIQSDSIIIDLAVESIIVEYDYGDVVLNPTRSEILVNMSDRIGIIDLSTGATIYEITSTNDKPIENVAYSPDGNRVIASYYQSGSMDIWDMGSGILIGELVAPCCVASMLWSNDNAQVYSTSNEANFTDTTTAVNIWDVGNVTSTIVEQMSEDLWGTSSIVHDTLGLNIIDRRIPDWIQHLPSNWIAPGINHARYDVDVTLTKGSETTCSYQGQNIETKKFVGTNTEVKIIDRKTDNVIAQNMFYGRPVCTDIAYNTDTEYTPPLQEPIQTWVYSQLVNLPDIAFGDVQPSNTLELNVSMYEEIQTGVVLRNANVRPCPELNNGCAPKGSINSDDIVEILGDISGDTYNGTSLWYYIRFDGQEAYIHSSMLKK